MKASPELRCVGLVPGEAGGGRGGQSDPGRRRKRGGVGRFPPQVHRLRTVLHLLLIKPVALFKSRMNVPFGQTTSVTVYGIYVQLLSLRT